jgi:erythromycin esterase
LDKVALLLGENGHGAGTFTTAKVRIVKCLHAQLGFDTLAFESGFFECRDSNERLLTEAAAEVMRRCLLAQFHHRELMPLFEYAAVSLKSIRPLRIAGLDFQVQGEASRSRSALFAEPLRAKSTEQAIDSRRSTPHTCKRASNQ